MKQAGTVADEYYQRTDRQGPAFLTEVIRTARRDALTDILAWCYQHPDRPAAAVVIIIHDVLHEGQL